MFLALPLVVPAIGVAAVAAITRYHLKGEDLTQYDGAELPVTFTPDDYSQGNEAVKEYLRDNYVRPAMEGRGKLSRKEQLAASRKRLDEAGLARESDCTIESATATGGQVPVTGEWVQAKGADPDRRLLYLHGGAGTIGSAVSHRGITTNLAERTGTSIFAANYRLMPENSRMASVEDSRAVYKWILQNGPDGPAPASKVAIAGDSAGGNLTLALSNWVRDSGLRPADAVVGISPAVDSTCSSPSIKTNFETDIMLQPLVGRILKVPQPVLLWMMWRAYRMSPAAPEISPIFANLSNLPPTLIHVSTAEMLYDDARRFVTKAQGQGSPVSLQSWAHMSHVWHAFDTMLPEAHQAFDEIANFLRQHGFAE